jgi:hypothetical protein
MDKLLIGPGSSFLTAKQPRTHWTIKEPMSGEPVFMLMGRDTQAPRLLREWADQREERIVAGNAPLTDQEAVAYARDMADAMEHWRRNIIALSAPRPMPLFEQRNNPV